jgi:hypothetical protein
MRRQNRIGASFFRFSQTCIFAGLSGRGSGHDAAGMWRVQENSQRLSRSVAKTGRTKYLI